MILDRADATAEIVPTQHGRMLCLPNDQYIGRDLRTQGVYSPGELALWADLLTPRMIVADVGANIGAHTIPLAQLVPDGLVLAFEPLPWLYRMLCANTVLNGCTHVLPYHAAVGAYAGRTIRVPGVDYTQEDTYGGLALGTQTEGNAVPLVTLDSIARTIDAIKIDVEGMEMHVLRGARRHLEAFPIVYCEAHPEEEPVTAGFLTILGYDVYRHRPRRFLAGGPDDTSPMLLALPSGRRPPDGHGLEPIP